MKNTQNQGGIARFSGLTAAGVLLVMSGTAVSLAGEEAPRANSRTVERVTPTKSVKKADSVQKTKAETPVRRGIYSATAKRIEETQPQVSGLTHADLVAISKLRAQELAGRRVISGSNPTKPDPIGGADEQSGGGVIIRPMTGGRKIDHTPPGPGDWNDVPGGPAMGVGYRNCFTHEFWSTRQNRINSTFPGYDPSTASFANGTPTFNIWPELPPPLDAPDLDGDGEIEDPLPQRPVIVYFQFLEEGMTEPDWTDGEDNFNMIALRSGDDGGTGTDDDGDGFLDDPDGVIDVNDPPDDTDGISDTWVEPFVVRDILPPPDPADFDPALSQWLQFNGLGTLPWGNGRPIFTHPDAEAAWRLAQREYLDVPGFTFEDSFTSNQVLEPEERASMLTAMQAISNVTNIVFIERADGTAGLAAGYPYAPKGYVTDPDGYLVDPGAFGGGSPGDLPFEPDDDYPWILIAKGEAAYGTAGMNFATQLGPGRSAGESDYSSRGAASGVLFLFDINGDGFPDTPDLDGDGLPDQIILSDASLTLDGGLPTGLSALDLDMSNDVTAMDTSVTNRMGIGTPDPGSVPMLTVGDLNGDGIPEALLDPDLDADPAVIDITTLQVDVDGDLVGDSLFPGGATASPAPMPFESVPCELLNISQAVLEGNDIGVMVHEVMHHLGFIHEQQRPDRNDFVRFNPNNVPPAQSSQFTQLGGGISFYANMIENFDTTVSGSTWTVTGAATAGAWAQGVPADPAGAVGPDLDFAVDDADLSMQCFTTGLAAGEDLDGQTTFTSDPFFGPTDAVVRFAYWLASDQPGALDAGDGLTVESSIDGGTTWTELMVLTDNERAWRETQITIGDLRDDGDNALPEFQIRFTASDINTDNEIEVGVDRIRVQNPYDFQSVMHYGTFGFSILPGVPGFEVLEVLPPNDAEFQDQIGNRNGLSIGDRVGLANLYGEFVPLPGDPTGEPCRADINLDGVINGGDIVLFLELYAAEDPAADFAEPIGVIDSLDLLQFFIDLQFSVSCISDGNNFGSNNFNELFPQ